MDLIGNREEPSSANPARVESKGQRDRGGRAQGPSCLTSKCEPRPPSLFQISRGEGQNPGQVAARLVVHSGETAKPGEGLQGITTLVGDLHELGRAPGC